MHFTGNLILLDVDIEGLKQAWMDAAQSQMRRAAAAFIKAAIPKVPVDTGMARGSFLNLGRYLRARGLDVDIPIDPKRTNYKNGRPILYYHRPGAPGIPKTPEQGAVYSTFSFNQGSPTKVQFTFDTNVTHYNLEDELGVRSGPWRSFDVGRSAFNAEMAQLKARLPKIGAFIAKGSISFGRNSTLTRAPKIGSATTGSPATQQVTYGD